MKCIDVLEDSEIAFGDSFEFGFEEFDVTMGLASISVGKSVTYFTRCWSTRHQGSNGRVESADEGAKKKAVLALPRELPGLGISVVGDEAMVVVEEAIVASGGDKCHPKI